MTDDVVVRPFSPDEWKLFRNLRLASLQESPDAFGSTHEAESAASDADWKSRLQGGIDSRLDLPLVAMLDNLAVGLAWGRVSPKEARVVHLFQMWVDPKYRRTGAGRLLLQTTIDWSKALSISHMELSVTEHNDAAIALYLSFGFKQVGEPYAFQPPRGGLMQLIMRLSLDIH